jgi:fructokinase
LNIRKCKNFPTTCFALSQNPARQTILEKATLASKLGLQLTIDINFSEIICTNSDEAASVSPSYLKSNPLA